MGSMPARPSHPEPASQPSSASSLQPSGPHPLPQGLRPLLHGAHVFPTPAGRPFRPRGRGGSLGHVAPVARGAAAVSAAAAAPAPLCLSALAPPEVGSRPALGRPVLISSSGHVTPASSSLRVPCTHLSLEHATARRGRAQAPPAAPSLPGIRAALHRQPPAGQPGVVPGTHPHSLAPVHRHAASQPRIAHRCIPRIAYPLRPHSLA